MQKDLFNYDKMGLDKETIRKISIILQGTSEGPGISSKLLNFTTIEEIDKFIILANRYFEGILQFVETEEKIVPIIINPDAYESKRRAISNKAIALACIILLHEFEYSQGPSFDILEQRLQSTNIYANELRRILRELKRNRWIREIKRENLTIYHTTTVLKSCISPEMLKKILREIDDEYADINLEPYLPKDYLEVRKKLKLTARQLSVMEVFREKKEEESNNG